MNNSRYTDPTTANDTLLSDDDTREITSATNPEMKDKDKDATRKLNEKTGKYYDEYPSHSPKQYFGNLIKVKFAISSSDVPVRKTLTLAILKQMNKDMPKLQLDVNANYRFLGSYKAFTTDKGVTMKIAEYANWTPNETSISC